MSLWERWGLFPLTVGISISGVLYYWMKYFLESKDPFSVINHPWQAGMLEVHLLLSPFLVFLVGVLTRSHIAKQLKKGTRKGRWSGLATLFLFPVMVSSGYLLQVSSNPSFSIWMSNVHLVSGIVFFLLVSMHQVVTWRIARKARSVRNGAERVRVAA